MRNLIDTIVGWVNPQAGLHRHYARKVLERAYEAASPRDGWRVRRAGASANADHVADAAVIRGKARALVQNVPYITAGIEALVAATVGTGISPRATGRESEKINKLLKKWMAVCDADGRLDYHGMIAAAYRAMEQDGEVLIRLRSRKLSDGLPVPLQLQLLEIDWLDSKKTAPSGQNQIINGIEYDPLGAVAAYWLWSQHPGDMSLLKSFRMESKRIPANQIIHLYAPARPGQGRGFSRLAPVISRVRDLQLYEDSELARKNLESRLSVIASGDVSQMANPASYGGAGDPVADAQRTGDLGELGSGSIIQAPAGMTMTVVEPKPSPGYVDYVKFNLHLIASGMGCTYEQITGDMTEVNFSSARVRLLDFRRNVSQMQWLILIPKCLIPIHEAFIEAAYLAQKIEVRDTSVDFSVPKFDYVNPEQDVKSDLAEISGGLSSVSEKLRQRGYNPKEVFEELKSDFDELEKLGILQTLLFLQKGNLPTPNASTK